MQKLVLAIAAMAALVLAGGAYAGSDRNFSTHLTGDAERPIARDTPAQGQAKVQLAKDGDSLLCKLNASNIENVFAAHIHLGSPDVAGPIVAWLYGPVPLGGGRTNGRLSTADLTDDDVIGPLAGQGIDGLMREIRAGNTYVNVHTNDGVTPTNTGPGDFPGGEIRGQL